MKVKFYKFRALLVLVIIRMLGKIFFVEIPPILSVAALIKRDEKFLFLNYSYMKGYGLPGGLVSTNENLEQALEREVKEETGLEIVTSTFFTSTTSIFYGLPTISIVFYVDVKGEEIASEEGALQWLKIEDVKGKMAYESAEIAIQKI